MSIYLLISFVGYCMLGFYLAVTEPKNTIKEKIWIGLYLLMGIYFFICSYGIIFGNWK